MWLYKCVCMCGIDEEIKRVARGSPFHSRWQFLFHFHPNRPFDVFFLLLFFFLYSKWINRCRVVRWLADGLDVNIWMVQISRTKRKWSTAGDTGNIRTPPSLFVNIKYHPPLWEGGEEKGKERGRKRRALRRDGPS